MSFLTALALAVVVFVGAPVAAHMLRRRKAEERMFSAVHLVPATPPLARRRSRLEDRGLFTIRALAVLALALLGATPLITCARLAVTRQGGASVALAIVVDDSLSMRAPMADDSGHRGKTRFERALEGARELAAGTRPGDAVAVVLAGAPPRVALASTTNLAAAVAAIDALEPSDRATDLDAAIRIARELMKDLPQPDKRVVLLSDLADGSPGEPLRSEGPIATWAPLPELEASGDDCALVRADRTGSKVRVRVVCTKPATPPAPRTLEIRSGAAVVAQAPHGGGRAEDVTIDLPEGAPDDLRAALTGEDSIAEDDQAPVVPAGGSLSIAVIADAAGTRVATGGAPPLEQALTALDLDAEVHPLPAVPEHPDELDAYAALIVDDAPGFTPEARRSIAAWVEQGGVALLTLGPRAASAPLGAGFEPLVQGVIHWGATPVRGVDPASATSFGASAEGLLDLAPEGRTVLDPAPGEGADVLARWSDGAPLLFERRLRRGALLALTLPLTTERSDLALRPAFLVLLDRLVDTARARRGARRIDVGEAWAFDGYDDVTAERLPDEPGGAPTPVPLSHDGGRLRVLPPSAGLYRFHIDGEVATRAASAPEREIDLRPRKVEPSARAESLGGVAATIDASPYVALLLLGLLAAELGLRLWGQRGALRGASKHA